MGQFGPEDTAGPGEGARPLSPTPWDDGSRLVGAGGRAHGDGLEVIEIHERPGQPAPRVKGKAKGAFSRPNVYHRAGRDPFRGVDPPADTHRARLLNLYVGVSHKGQVFGRESRPFFERWSPAGGSLAIAGLSCLLVASALTAQGTTPTAYRWRGLVGRTVIDVQSRVGEVRVGLAGDSVQVALVLEATAVRRVADSAGVLLTRRGTTPWSLRVEEAGAGLGALELTRRTVRGRSVYAMFAADDVVGGVRDSLAVGDLRILVRTLRAAAAAALPSRRGRPPG